MTAREHLQRVGTRVALWLLAWIFIVLIDPLASYSFVASKSAKLMSQVAAPFYGLGSGKAPQRNEIAVLVLTQEDRTAFQNFR